MTALAPILLEPRLDSRLWGGDRLADFMGLKGAPSPLAEAWLVYEENLIRSGPFAGRKLKELVSAEGAALLGTVPFAQWGAEFPLLAKLIDAKDRLSLQVHPDDAFAHEFEKHTGFHGKTEAWYVLAADPDGDVFLGFEHEVDRETVRAAAVGGTLEKLMHRRRVKAGDTVFVPARTVHGINGGTMIFEIQQKSDLTYRLYDYGRVGPDGKPRELHLDRGLAVADLGPTQPGPARETGRYPWATSTVRCSHFELEQWEVSEPRDARTSPSTFEILVPVRGVVTLTAAGMTTTLRSGEAVVLPATLGAYRVTGAPGTQLLASFVPTS